MLVPYNSNKKTAFLKKNFTLEKEIYIIAILGVAWLTQVLYYLLIMARTLRKKPAVATTGKPPVSIVICAKNEQENLERNLPLVLNQNYPNFQVVVVNDCSEDDTEMVLARFKQTYQHLYYTTIPVDKKFFHGKKLALTIGIKAAQHELMLLTDADCAPATPEWLSAMTSHFTPGKELVLGYGKYKREKGFLNMLIRYETFWNAIQYMGHAMAAKPFMAVGRNIAYTKSLFNKGSQFRNSLTLASGDDDLFVMEAGTCQNTTICFEPKAQTISLAAKTLEEWLVQKARHLSTAAKIPFTTKVLLGTEIFSRQIFYLLTLYSLIFNTFAPIVIGLFLSRLLLIHVIIFKAAQRFEEKGMSFVALLMDLLIPWFQAMAWLFKFFGGKRNKWR